MAGHVRAISTGVLNSNNKHNVSFQDHITAAATPQSAVSGRSDYASAFDGANDDETFGSAGDGGASSRSGGAPTLRKRLPANSRMSRQFSAASGLLHAESVISTGSVSGRAQLYITVKDIKAGVNTYDLGLSDEECELLFARLDQDPPGLVLLSDLEAQVRSEGGRKRESAVQAEHWARDIFSRLGREVQQQLVDGFCVFDRLNAQTVNKSFFRTVLHLFFPKMTSSQLEVLYELADKTKNGEVGYRSFVRYITTSGKRA